MRSSRLPYYAYLATPVTSTLFLSLVLVAVLRDGSVPVGVLRLALTIAALHMLAVAAMVVLDWRGVIRRLRVVCRAQQRRWPWSRRICRATGYRDSDRWWRWFVGAGFVPISLWLLVLAASG